MFGEDGFRVWRRPHTSSTWTSFDVGPNILQFVDTGLVEGTAYVYRVETKVGTEFSPYSSMIYPRTLPAAPSNVTGVALDQSQIRVNWQDNSSNETAYFVERRVGAGGSWSGVQLGSNVTTHTFGSLPASTIIYVRVHARAGSYKSAYVYLVGGIKTAPAPPSGLTGSAASSTSVQLNWVDNSTDETYFYVERRQGTGGTWVAQALNPNTTSLLRTGLLSGQTYYFRVRARRNAAYSTYSNQIQVTTP